MADGGRRRRHNARARGSAGIKGSDGPSGDAGYVVITTGIRA